MVNKKIDNKKYAEYITDEEFNEHTDEFIEMKQAELREYATKFSPQKFISNLVPDNHWVDNGFEILFCHNPDDNKKWLIRGGMNYDISGYSYIICKAEDNEKALDISGDIMKLINKWYNIKQEKVIDEVIEKDRKKYIWTGKKWYCIPSWK